MALIRIADQFKRTVHVPEREHSNDLVAELRALFAELLGTFALTFVGAGAIMIDAASGHQLSYIPRVVSPGLLVMVMIYTLGDVSGAHINPAVTLAFALRGAFAWARVPFYWAAQLIGAFLAPLVLQALVGYQADLGATLPKMGSPAAFGMEIILTTLLISVIIGTATGNKLVGQNAGLAVGATIALCGLIGDPLSGASMNPARSLGPILLAGKFDAAWIYVVGPALGALIAVFFAWVMHGSPTRHEKEAATGSQEQAEKNK